MNRQPRSSILLIDHPSRDPPSTRICSMQLDGKIVETRLDTGEVSDFRKYSLQNSSKNMLCFTKYGTDSPACLLDIVNNKLITLPKPKNPKRSGCMFYGVGYDARIRNYKTLCIAVENLGGRDGVHNYAYYVAVNTLGEDSWRATDFVTPSGSILGKPISIDGAIAWADFPQTDMAYSSQRYANVFKISEEKFLKVALPWGLRVGHLVGINGQLCAVDLSSDLSIRILISRNLDKNWETLGTIKMRATRGEKDHRRTRVIGDLGDGKLVLKSYASYFVYDLGTDELEYLHLPVETNAETEVHCHNRMLTSFNSVKSAMATVATGLELQEVHLTDSSGDGWEIVESED